MQSRAVKNAGYLLALVPQVLLVVGTHTDIAWLVPVFFFMILPLVRKFIGNDWSLPNQKLSPFLGWYLRAIPRLYCACWALVLPWTIWMLATKPMTMYQYISFALALWIVCSLNMTIVHELIHSRSSVNRQLGSFLGATVGYFHFTEEHLSHHASNGSHTASDAAIPGISIYVFAFRRYVRSLHVASIYECARLKRAKARWFSNRLIGKMLIPITVATTYCVFAGKVGLGIYLFQVVGAAFSVQAITYLQHWGLSQEVTPAMASYGYAWEDGCWMQACVTLNHAFHGQHHLSTAQPYYALSFNKVGLLLPAAYPIMFVVALFPAFFTRIMKVRLALWIERAETSVGDADCIGTTRVVQAIRDT